ncbi:MAG: hypothetical protein ACYC2G_02755 [Gemmatimonadaceae bacterium]
MTSPLHPPHRSSPEQANARLAGPLPPTVLVVADGARQGTPSAIDDAAGSSFR